VIVFLRGANQILTADYNTLLMFVQINYLRIIREGLRVT
jgi:hypothetical protein